MAGQTAGPIKTKLGMGTHVDPGSVLGKVKVMWRHLANSNKTPYRGLQGLREFDIRRTEARRADTTGGRVLTASSKYASIYYRFRDIATCILLENRYPRLFGAPIRGEAIELMEA